MNKQEEIKKLKSRLKELETMKVYFIGGGYDGVCKSFTNPLDSGLKMITGKIETRKLWNITDIEPIYETYNIVFNGLLGDQRYAIAEKKND